MNTEPIDISFHDADPTEGARFSIIIPSWNNLHYLQCCIGSIRKNSRYPHQIIVHVNEGSDGTLEWVRSQPDLAYSVSGKNIGVCYAVNAAASLARTDYIAYMNDDMYVCPEWDRYIWEEIERIGHKFFSISSTIIERNSPGKCSIEGDFGDSPDSLDEARLLREWANPSFRDWSGSTWPPNIVHRDVWNLVGGYSPEFSPGICSDPDFSMKLWLLGVRVFRGLEKSRVYHFGSKTLGRVTLNRGNSTFILKWGITQKLFTKFWLRRGEAYSGNLSGYKMTFWVKLRCVYRQFQAIFRRDRCG